MTTVRWRARARLFMLLATLHPLCHDALGATQVYRSVDAQGRVTFSDRPCPEAEQVELPQPNVVTPGGSPAYARIAFGVPRAGSVVPADGADSFELRLDTEPRLRTGHRVQLFVDGEAAGQPTSSCIFTISSITAGSHRFEARVLGLGNEELGRSEPLLLEVGRTLGGKEPAAPEPQAGATACFSRAPSVRAGIPPYQLPERRRLADAQQQSLQSLFRAIGANWRGEGSQTSCREVDGQPTASTERLEIQAGFTERKEGFRIEYHTRFTGIGTRGSGSLDLELHEGVLMRGGVVVDLQELSETTLRFSLKERLPGTEGHPGLWQETAWHIVRHDPRLAIERHFYTNGQLMTAERWDLAR